MVEIDAVKPRQFCGMGMIADDHGNRAMELVIMMSMKQVGEAVQLLPLSARRPLAPACHHRRHREAVDENRDRDRRERQRNRELREVLRQPVIDREHQVIDGTDAADPEPSDQKVLAATQSRGGQAPGLSRTGG